MEEELLSPICLFTYNRLTELELTVEALKNNYLAKKSDLIIFSDGPKDDTDKKLITDVRVYLQQISGFKTVRVVESDSNNGLANSVISGVSDEIQKHGRVIVIEDDLITSPSFLSFMNQALDFYEHDENVQSVAGFSFPLNNISDSTDVYFQKRPSSWGWATWSNHWDVQIFNKESLRNEIQLDKSILKSLNKSLGNDIPKMFLDSINDRNNSWYVRWAYNHFKNSRYSVYPKYSLVENIGFGDSATHCTGVNAYSYKLDNRNKEDFNFNSYHSPGKQLTVEFLRYFSRSYKFYARVVLLGSKAGRKQLYKEIRSRLLFF